MISLQFYKMVTYRSTRKPVHLTAQEVLDTYFMDGSGDEDDEKNIDLDPDSDKEDDSDILNDVPQPLDVTNEAAISESSFSTSVSVDGDKDPAEVSRSRSSRAVSQIESLDSSDIEEESGEDEVDQVDLDLYRHGKMQ
ncbi:hypothetical protein EGW08_013034 [Elysia chlorotica]|uniref:Uncharacterized protein n=1 Tax=Elysia chlorotica TaxID=188477 RepID=A0A433TC91_ELYCH|nr:hypothetical protein EGW08_013034 [Elysia chlorotica]